MQKQYDAVIIGSGFGGSVSALRLAETGKSVLVLERGKNYLSGEFPRNPQILANTLWRYPDISSDQGLFDLRFFSDMGVLTASGVGGGSLIYSNINIKPDKDLFSRIKWPSSLSFSALDPFYQRVESELSLQVMPEGLDLKARKVMHKAGNEVGASIITPGFSVDWDNCRQCAECGQGCNYDAKQSMDKTYLKKAQEKGAIIRSGAWVYVIEPTFSGYYIHFRDLTKNGQKVQVKARVVVLAAGALGTNELLLRNRDIYDTLPAVSATLGKGFSANGDFIGSIQNCSIPMEAWRGANVAAVLGFSGKNAFTVAAQGGKQSSMEVVAAMGQMSGKILQFFGPVVWRHLSSILPWMMAKGALSQPVPITLQGAGPADRCISLFASGQDNANGIIKLKSSGIDIAWDFARENLKLIENMVLKMTELATVMQGTFSPLASWNMAKRPITVNPLGGCAMSDNPDSGVVSPCGEVHGHAKLFISDGSIIPGALGVHPAMTISALAEHNAQEIINSI